MIKRILIISLFVLAAVSCSGSRNESTVEIIREEPFSSMRETTSHVSNIQVESGQMLPPYGTTVTAESALLKLRINSTLEEAVERMADVQKTISAIDTLASENELITLEYISVNRVNGKYTRETSVSDVQNNVEASSVTLTLAAELADNNRAFWESVIVFDEFVNAVALSDTITIEMVSITTVLGALETYRHQLVAQVYQELDSVREAYGSSVQFEITGLHDDLKIIQLNDTEYYIYLDPSITAGEF